MFVVLKQKFKWSISILLLLASSLAWSEHGMVISDAWVRAVPSVSKMTAAYLTIENHTGQDDVLLAARGPLARVIEIHTMAEENGMRSMKRLPSISIANGSSITLEPGGMHLMLIDLCESLAPDQMRHIELKFQHAGWVSLEAIVRKPF